MNILKNIKDSYAHIPYTLKHKKAMLILEKKFTGKNTLRIFLHDTDKVVMYALLPFLNPDLREIIHHSLCRHHEIYPNTLSEDVLKEIVLDWESAHYTKADKKLNAVDYCLIHKPWFYPYLCKYFKEWGLEPTTCSTPRCIF